MNMTEKPLRETKRNIEDKTRNFCSILFEK